MKIVVGTTDSNRITDTRFDQLLDVEEVSINSDYNDLAYFDLALIKVKEEITFSVEVHPICVPLKVSMIKSSAPLLYPISYMAKSIKACA